MIWILSLIYLWSVIACLILTGDEMGELTLKVLLTCILLSPLLIIVTMSNILFEYIEESNFWESNRWGNKVIWKRKK